MCILQHLSAANGSDWLLLTDQVFHYKLLQVTVGLELPQHSLPPAKQPTHSAKPAGNTRPTAKRCDESRSGPEIHGEIPLAGLNVWNRTIPLVSHWLSNISHQPWSMVNHQGSSRIIKVGYLISWYHYHHPMGYIPNVPYQPCPCHFGLPWGDNHFQRLGDCFTQHHLGPGTWGCDVCCQIRGLDSD